MVIRLWRGWVSPGKLFPAHVCNDELFYIFTLVTFGFKYEIDIDLIYKQSFMNIASSNC